MIMEETISQSLATQRLLERLMALPTLYYEFPCVHGFVYVHLGGGDDTPKGDYIRDYAAVSVRWKIESRFRNGGFLPRSLEFGRAIANYINELICLTNIRREGLYTAEEQYGYIDRLDLKTKQELLWQIEFYEVCMKYRSAAAEAAEYERKQREENDVYEKRDSEELLEMYSRPPEKSKKRR